MDQSSNKNKTNVGGTVTAAFFLILFFITALIALDILFYPSISRFFLGYEGNSWWFHPGVGTGFLYAIFIGLPAAISAFILLIISMSFFAKHYSRKVIASLWLLALLFLTGATTLHLHRDYPYSPVYRKSNYSKLDYETLAKEFDSQINDSYFPLSHKPETVEALAGRFPEKAVSLFEQAIFRSDPHPQNKYYLFEKIKSLDQAAASRIAKQVIQGTDPGIKSEMIGELVYHEPSSENLEFLLAHIDREKKYFVIRRIIQGVMDVFRRRLLDAPTLDSYRQIFIDKIEGTKSRKDIQMYAGDAGWFDKLIQELNSR